MGQGAAQPCCPAHGLDACGAGHFCAAFDGRTQPTCYAEGARKDEESCTEDRQCASGSCNADLQLCRSQPHSICDPAIGCAPDELGVRHACHIFTGRCTAVGNGFVGEVCVDDSDCDGFECRNSLCKGPEICGELTGQGVCARDFFSMDCARCRVQAVACGSTCGSTWQALEACMHDNGCVSERTGDIDVACADVRCDELLCEMERCAAERCGKSSCY